MRQQYHSKKIDGKNYVWDVHKLVEHTKGLPVIEMPLEDIQELNENHWFGEGSWREPMARDFALHAMLINECDLSHPIILHADGRIMDGMHRCCKALIEGRKTIRAVRFEEAPEPDHIDPDWDTLPYNDNFWETLKRFGLPYKE